MLRKLTVLLFVLCAVCLCAQAVEGEWIIHEETELAWGSVRWFDDSVLDEASPKGRTQWHSTNSSAATVDRWGNVQAAKPEEVQTTLITAQRGNSSYTWKVTVRPLSQQVQILSGDTHAGQFTIDLSAGQTQLPLRAVVLPEGASSQVRFTVREYGADIDENGLFTAQRDGSYTVSVMAADKGRAQAECIVHAIYPVSAVALSGPGQITSGETSAVTAAVGPENATYPQLEWTSSDETVLKVDKNGNIKAMPVADITVVSLTASAVDGSGVSETIDLTVVPAAEKVELTYNGAPFHPQSLIFDDSFVGTVIEMSASVSPAQANQQVKWQSSNNSIIKVDGSGRIGVAGRGTCRITAEAADGSGAKRVLYVSVGNVDKYPYYIEVDKGNQVVRVYEKDEKGLYTVLSRRMVCSTGTHEHGVSNGLYNVHSTRLKWMGTILEGVYCQYGTRFDDMLWFHSLPYQGTNASRMDAYAYSQLGTQASHGCIRLLTADAKWIYENVPGGSWMLVCKCERTESEYAAVTWPEAPGRWDPTDDNPNNPDYDPLYTSAVRRAEFAPENPQNH